MVTCESCADFRFCRYSFLFGVQTIWARSISTSVSIQEQRQHQSRFSGWNDCLKISEKDFQVSKSFFGGQERDGICKKNGSPIHTHTQVWYGWRWKDFEVCTPWHTKDGRLQIRGSRFFLFLVGISSYAASKTGYYWWESFLFCWLLASEMWVT